MARRTSEPKAANSSAVLFGAEMKHAREQAGYSQAELAKLLHCDRSLITRIESGQRVPQEDFAVNCDRVLHTDGVLFRLWSRIDWYADVEHPDWFRRFVEMEANAVAVRTFGVQLTPGLLQTENYMRALFSRGDAAGNEDLIEEWVAARLSRQHRFLADEAPLLVVVLDESAIRRVVGGPSVMRGQLAHLLAVAERPNIALQVMPFHHYDVARPRVSMTLMSLPNRHEWVYSESLDRGHFSDDPVMVTRRSRTYDLLRADALSARESAALITRAMEGYDHDEYRSWRGEVAQEQLQRRQRRRVHRGGPRLPRRCPRP